MLKIASIIYFISLTLLFGSCSKSDSVDTYLDTIPPTAPTNLVANNTTSTTTILSWGKSTDNVGVKDYTVYRDETVIGVSQEATFQVNNLSANSTYLFKIIAKDAAGNKSGFSNTYALRTFDDSAVIIKKSGDIETYIGIVIENSPGSSGNNYIAPNENQLSTWENIISAILIGDYNEAVLKANFVNYQISEFTDISSTPNKVFYILEEKAKQSYYWGTYVFSKTPEIANLILQAPHSKHDTNTGNQAVYCFKRLQPVALFINGTHRCNNSSSSTCSGTTTACGSNASYRISDMAHNINSMFQRTTEYLFDNIPNSVFVQLHGFTKEITDPYVIISNGTRKNPTTDYVSLIKEALFLEDNSLTFKIAHIDTNWTRLNGLTNTQGRYVNGSSNPCSTDASVANGRFVHIEQEKSKLRNDQLGWKKMSNALKKVFQ